jgi:L-lactate dehydrogenase complex protein LldE
LDISLMATCLGDCIRPAAPQAVVRVLRRLGHRVHFLEDQTCCGQPLFNSGFHDMAQEQAKYTIRIFEANDFPIVVPSGSCAAMVKVEYPKLFPEGDPWRVRAESLAERVFEFADFLVNHLQVTEVGAKFEGKVAHHFACHNRMLEPKQAVEKLIGSVAGAQYVDLVRQDQCCGFGGSFAVRYGSISAQLADDKARCVLATGASALVSTDAGCLMNIEGRLRRLGGRVEVMHIAELLEKR